MGRKGETTKFKGAKPAPSEAAKKERARKKKRDREEDGAAGEVPEEELGPAPEEEGENAEGSGHEE